MVVLGKTSKNSRICVVHSVLLVNNHGNFRARRRSHQNTAHYTRRRRLSVASSHHLLLKDTTVLNDDGLLNLILLLLLLLLPELVGGVLVGWTRPSARIQRSVGAPRLPFARLDSLLLHRQRPVDVVQFVVEAAGTRQNNIE